MDGNEKVKDASATPILDSVLAELGPTKVVLALRLNVAAVTQIQQRLLARMRECDLTQRDLEDELRGLPEEIRGFRADIVDYLRQNLPEPYGSDIRNLPSE